MNPEINKMHLEAIRRALSAVSLVADELHKMASVIPPGCADGSTKRIDGFSLQQLSDTLKAAEDSATGSCEWLEKEAMK